MSLKLVKLYDVTDELESGSRPKGGVSDIGDIPSLGAEHLDENGRFNFSKIKKVPIDFFNNQKSGKIYQNDILIVKDGATTGKACYVDHNFPFSEASLNEHVFRIKVNSKIAFSKYVFYYLFSPEGKKAILSDFRGATVGGISKSFINNVSFNLPPLEIQRHIAAILDKADNLRRLNKQLVRKYDELEDSLFTEMFGDELKLKKLTIKSLNDVAEIVSGVTKGRRFKGKVTIETPYMRVANVQDGHIDLSEIKTIEVLPDDIEKYRLKFGDVLLTEGGDPDKLGRGAVWKFDIQDCIYQNHIFRVRVNQEILNWDYLSALLGKNYGKKYFLKAAKQTTGIASINSTQLRKFPVPIPSLSLQNKYAILIEKIEVQKSLAQEALAKSEDLFQGLLQGCFKGGL